MTIPKPPELLAPAGNLEKCQIAFSYGADACYVGISSFGLRKHADNFRFSELKVAIDLANRLSKSIYVVLNGFAHEQDLDILSTSLLLLEEIQPHSLIVADIGVFLLAQSITSIPIHVSTQASVTHSIGCEYWKQMGAKRVILGRETSISDCHNIKHHCDIELESFVHGAMCASFSGKCVISNYTAARDSNRGGCVQSCRHQFDIMDKSHVVGTTTHIMNAKDLSGIDLIPELIDSGICSLKIEGRMKSTLYVANTVSVYRQAIDAYMDGTFKQRHRSLTDRLSWVSNRDFSTGGLQDTPKFGSINYSFSHYNKRITYIGHIIHVSDNGFCYLSAKSPFEVGDTLCFMSASNPDYSVQITELFSVNDDPISKANTSSIVYFRNPATSNYDIAYQPIEVLASC